MEQLSPFCLEVLFRQSFDLIFRSTERILATGIYLQSSSGDKHSGESSKFQFTVSKVMINGINYTNHELHFWLMVALKIGLATFCVESLLEKTIT